jgi:hypothetical protein
LSPAAEAFGGKVAEALSPGCQWARPDANLRQRYSVACLKIGQERLSFWQISHLEVVSDPDGLDLDLHLDDTVYRVEDAREHKH